jgi:hypothetical protein
MMIGSGIQVILWLKARILESQQLAVTRQQPVNNNRGMLFSEQSMPIAVMQQWNISSHC